MPCIWPPGIFEGGGSGRPPSGSPLNPDSDQCANLVACWPGDEGSGLLLQEVVGARHATPSDTASTPGLYGWAGTRDFGVAPAIGSGAHAWLAPGTTGLDLSRFTVCCRVQLTSKEAFGGPIKHRVASKAGFHFASEESGSTAFTPHLVVVNAAGTELANRQGPIAYALPMVTSHHFVWTWDGTTARFWADGTEQATSSGASGWGGVDPIFGPGTILGRGYTTALGPIGDVRIYDAARPEIGTLYADPGTRWDLYRPTRGARSFAVAPASPQSAALPTAFVAVGATSPTRSAAGSASRPLPAAPVAVAASSPAGSGTGFTTSVLASAVVLVAASSPPASAGGRSTAALAVATVLVGASGTEASGVGAASRAILPAAVLVGATPRGASGAGTAARTLATATVLVAASSPGRSAFGAAPAALGSAVVVVSASSPDGSVGEAPALASPGPNPRRGTVILVGPDPRRGTATRTGPDPRRSTAKRV